MERSAGMDPTYNRLPPIPPTPPKRHDDPGESDVGEVKRNRPEVLSRGDRNARHRGEEKSNDVDATKEITHTK